MNLFISFLYGLIFFALTPNVLVRIPQNGSKYTVAAVHAFIFVIVIFILHRFLFRLMLRSFVSSFFEGADGDACTTESGQEGTEDSAGKCIAK